MSARNDAVDAVNRRAYADQHVVRCYGALDFIHAPERVILESLRANIENKPVLDIGVGGGRTTKFLLDFTNNYTGIDYSQAAVDAVQTKLPGVDLRCMDARNLNGFADETFALVVFSFNGIDYMSHDDRMKTMREIHRVLAPAGHFVFSTHNRDYCHFNKQPWHQTSARDFVFLKSCLYSLLYMPRHVRMKKLEVHTDEYAIVNDNAHHFTLLTYYIRAGEQRRQLSKAGFSNVQAVDMKGEVIDRDDQFPWVYYVAEKCDPKIIERA